MNHLRTLTTCCTILFTSLNIFLHAQDTLKLKIDNPAPRVGDALKFSFSFTFFQEELENQLSEGVEPIRINYYDGSDFSQYEMSVELKESGEQTIGPFEFEFNGKEIITDSIVLNVSKKLPMIEGAWIQVVQDHEGTQYLIIEQLTKDGSSLTTYNENYGMYEGFEEDDNFAQLAEQNFEGVSLSFQQSRSERQYDSDSNDPFADGLTYSFKKYKIHFDYDFKGSFTFKKKYFVNLPKLVKVKNLTVVKN
jgi:hypothetical protein